MTETIDPTTTPAVREALDGLRRCGATVTLAGRTLAGSTRYAITVAGDGYRLTQRYVSPAGLADALDRLLVDVGAVLAMRAAGYEVVLAGGEGTPYRVTVSKRNIGGKVHEPRWLHKRTTTSTSGYPIGTAYEKWCVQRAATMEDRP